MLLLNKDFLTTQVPDFIEDEGFKVISLKMWDKDGQNIKILPDLVAAIKFENAEIIFCDIWDIHDVEVVKYIREVGPKMPLALMLTEYAVEKSSIDLSKIPRLDIILKPDTSRSINDVLERCF